MDKTYFTPIRLFLFLFPLPNTTICSSETSGQRDSGFESRPRFWDLPYVSNNPENDCVSVLKPTIRLLPRTLQHIGHCHLVFSRLCTKGAQHSRLIESEMTGQIIEGTLFSIITTFRRVYSHSDSQMEVFKCFS